MKVSIEVVNLGEVLESLEEEVNTSGDELRKAIIETALFIEREAVNNINIMRAVDTGRLKNSIHTEAKGLNSYRGSAANEPGDEKFSVNPKDEFEAIVGTAVEYAKYVEFGLGTNRRKGERPFLRRARDKGEKYLWKILRR